MKRLALPLVAAALPLAAAYSPYESSTFAAPPPNWQAAGSLQYGAAGLTATGTSGTLVYTAAAGAAEEVRLDITIAASGGTYTAYLLAGTTDLSTANLYALEVNNPYVDETGCWAPARFWKRVNGRVYELMSYTQYCRHNGQNRLTLRAYARPGMQLVWTSPNSAYSYFDNDANIQSGRSGIGLANTPGGNSVTWGRLFHGESVAPPAPERNSVGMSAFPDRVELQWKGVSDGAEGSGVLWYIVSRGGTYIGSGVTPQFTDNNVQAGAEYNYQILAQDNNGNYGAPVAVVVKTPAAGTVVSRRTGVRVNGAYWGGAGEQIDMFTGNLNFTMPLFQALARGGWSVTFALSYNSQMWRKDPGGVWRFGGDMGYGWGWRLQAGAIVPSWRDSWWLDHYTYIDATGAEYRLDRQQSNGWWTSRQGVYVSFDPLAGRLYFPDGSFWLMGCISAGEEDDAGTYYPTVMQDSNGNQILVRYYAGAGVPDGDTSGRIRSIQDIRATTDFMYNWNQAIPRLEQIRHPAGWYSLSYTTGVPLTDPFDNAVSAAGVTRLDRIQRTLFPASHEFEYSGAMELISTTTPLGGRLRWQYLTWTYTGSRSFREVSQRYQRSSAGAGETVHQIWNDTTSGGYHAYSAVADWGNNHQKVWDFYGPGEYFGLPAASYERQGPDWNPRVYNYYTWASDANGQPYISRHRKVNDINQSYAAESSTWQTVDVNGNVGVDPSFETTS